MHCELSASEKDAPIVTDEYIAPTFMLEHKREASTISIENISRSFSRDILDYATRPYSRLVATVHIAIGVLYGFCAVFTDVRPPDTLI